MFFGTIIIGIFTWFKLIIYILTRFTIRSFYHKWWDYAVLSIGDLFFGFKFIVVSLAYITLRVHIFYIVLRFNIWSLSKRWKSAMLKRLWWIIWGSCSKKHRLISLGHSSSYLSFVDALSFIYCLIVFKCIVEVTCGLASKGSFSSLGSFTNW